MDEMNYDDARTVGSMAASLRMLVGDERINPDQTYVYRDGESDIEMSLTPHKMPSDDGIKRMILYARAGKEEVKVQINVHSDLKL